MSTTGAKVPTAASTTSETGWSGNTWVTPENLYGAGNAEITAATFDAGVHSRVLRAYGFDFSAIPDNATITGVKVYISGAYYATAICALGLAQLLNTSGARVGTNMYTTNVNLTTSPAEYTKGGDGENWGNSLTPSWVKNANFGVGIGIIVGASNNCDVFIDAITMEIFYTAPAAYSLSAASGGFSMSGTAVSLKATRKLIAGSGSFTMVGGSVGLLFSRELWADDGSEVWADEGSEKWKDAGSVGYSLIASAGSFTLSGSPVALKATRILSAVGGSFSLFGSSVVLIRKFTLIASPETYTLEGVSVSLRATRCLVAATGSFSLEGASVALKKGYAIIANGGEYGISGSTVALRKTWILPVSSVAFNLSGQTVGLLATRKLVAGVAEFILTGDTVELTWEAALTGYVLTATSGIFGMTGNSVALLKKSLLPTSPGEFSLNGTPVLLLAKRKITANGATYILSGQSVELTYSEGAPEASPIVGLFSIPNIPSRRIGRGH